MSIKLPDLPEDYRWVYQPDYIPGDPVLKLQRRGRWWWKTLGYTWVHAGIWRNEQIAIDRAAEKLILLVKQADNYGVYSTKRKNDY